MTDRRGLASPSGNEPATVGHAGTFTIITNTWRKLLPKNVHGYQRVTLYDGDGHRKQRMIHQLVLEQFVGPRPSGYEVLHDDNDRANNRLSNIKWGTKSENMKDQVRHGTHIDNRGEKSGNAKLTEADIASLKLLRSRKWTMQSLADSFGISISHVHRIIHGKRWAHLSGR